MKRRTTLDERIRYAHEAARIGDAAVAKRLDCAEETVANWRRKHCPSSVTKETLPTTESKQAASHAAPPVGIKASTHGERLISDVQENLSDYEVELIYENPDPYPFDIEAELEVKTDIGVPLTVSKYHQRDDVTVSDDGEVFQVLNDMDLDEEQREEQADRVAELCAERSIYISTKFHAYQPENLRLEVACDEIENLPNIIATFAETISDILDSENDMYSELNNNWIGV